VDVILTFPEVKGGVALLGCVEVALGLPRLGQQEAAVLFLVHETAANIRRDVRRGVPKTSARGAICRMADYHHSLINVRQGCYRIHIQKELIYD
jgi:hypothetical protein